MCFLKSLATAALAATLLATSAMAGDTDMDVVPDRLLVKLHGADDRRAAQEMVKRIGQEAGANLLFERESILGWTIVKVEGGAELVGRDLAEVAHRLSEVPGVGGVEMDRILRASATPNDPQLAAQYAVDVMQLEDAWDITTGTANTVVAILDTGVVQHEDLQGAVIGGFDFISDTFTANDGDGRDADFTDEGDGADCGNGFRPSSFHGTMVSGVTAARFDNGLGVAGTAPNVSLIEVRVLGRCGGSTVDINEGAYWAAGGEIDGLPSNPNPAKVLNLSLGGNGQCDAFSQDVFSAIDAAGRVVVVAAGNEASDTAFKHPVSCNGVIGVAASDHENFLSSFSNFGDEVDIIAPGGDIDFYGSEEAGIRTTTGPGFSDYTFTEGTSFSSPYVAGVAALLVSQDPTLDRGQVRALLQANGQAGFCPDGNGQFSECPRVVVNAAAVLSSFVDGVVPPPVQGQPPVNNEEVAALTCGVTVAGFASERVDISMTLPVQTEAILELNWAGSADLDLYIFDSADQLLGSSEAEGTNVESLEGVLIAGDYVVAVNPYAGSSEFTISLSCPELELGDDDDDGNGNGNGDGDGDGGRQRKATQSCTVSGSSAPLQASIMLLGLAVVGLRRRSVK